MKLNMGDPGFNQENMAVSYAPGKDNLPSKSTELLKQVQSLSVIRYQNNLF